MLSTKPVKSSKSSKSSKLNSSKLDQHTTPKNTSTEKYQQSQHQYNHNRRIMTSAIDSMSVAEVRKFLGEIRRKYQVQTPSDPMYITDNLPNGMQLQEFALKFQQGHHQKRHNKNWKTKSDGTSSDEEDDDYYDTFNSSENDSDYENITITPKSQLNIESTLFETKQIPTTSGQSSISNDISSVLVKKRGRPKKNTSPSSDKNQKTKPTQNPLSKPTSASQESQTKHNESHSRSLLEYMKKPSKRTKH